MDRSLPLAIILLLLLGCQIECTSLSADSTHGDDGGGGGKEKGKRQQAIEPKADSAESGDSTEENDSWLLPKTAITEAIYAINKADNANGLVDLDVKPSPNDVARSKAYNEKKNAIRARHRLWRSRIIHYVLDDSLDSKAVDWIKVAMEEFHTKTCIRFKELTAGVEHYIKFIKDNGCYSHIGKIEPENDQKFQPISIGKGCAHKGIVIHELMHAIGFYHEQSRYDRDEYVKIIDSNIKQGKKHNFAKKNVEDVTGLGLPYDYDGLMHYGAYAFARDKSMPTIVKLQDTGGPIGQRKGLSKTDLEQINLLYDCKTDSSVHSWSSWSRWSSCFDAGNGAKERSQRFCFRDDLSECPGADSDGVELREQACRNVSEKTPITNEPADIATEEMKTATGDSINEPICGTRVTTLAHPILHPQHIVGGQHALPGDWPWQVGIATKGSKFIYCGGTLISNQWVVSAAHCFRRDASVTTARLGEHNQKIDEGNEEVITLSRIIKHPLYDSATYDYDIALLKLSRPVNYTRYIRPACLPPSDFKVEAGADTFVSGWGKIKEFPRVTSAVLKVANVPIISNDKCGYRKGRLTSRMICAGYQEGGIDSCQGDSGGPLVLENENGKFTLIGVVSWGKGCARPNRGGVYASVPALRSYIDEVLTSNLTAVLLEEEATLIRLLTCSFEDGLCNWKQSRHNDFNWKREKEQGIRPGTGPIQSSTKRNGYLFIDTSSPRKKGDRAILISPEIRPTAPSCFSFKAYMHGENLNAQIIVARAVGSVRARGVRHVRVLALQIAGDQGNRWHTYNIDLPKGGRFKVEIIARCGKDYQGVIAIDELKVSLKPCRNGEAKNPSKASSSWASHQQRHFK